MHEKACGTSCWTIFTKIIAKELVLIESMQFKWRAWLKRAENCIRFELERQWHRGLEIQHIAMECRLSARGSLAPPHCCPDDAVIVEYFCSMFPN